MTPTDSNVSMIPEDAEWETIAEESGEKLKFDTVGQKFIGTYEGISHITPKDTEKEEFDQLLFRDPSGKLCALNAGYKLLETFSGEGAPAKGTLVRLTYVGDVQTGQPSPMKDFRVDISKTPPAKTK